MGHLCLYHDIREMNQPSADISPVSRGSEGSNLEGGEALSRAEFARLLTASSRILWHIAATAGERSAAEDVVQEATVIGLSKLSEFRSGSNFTAWMGQIVRYVAMNQGRKADRQETLSRTMVLGNPIKVDSNSDATLSNAGDDARVESAMAGMDSTARACLVLRLVERMTYAQIAVSLGIPEGTAMSHVFRAKRALVERLADTEVRTR